MLQSKAGYIDARPLTASSAKPLATRGRILGLLTATGLGAYPRKELEPTRGITFSRRHLYDLENEKKFPTGRGHSVFTELVVTSHRLPYGGRRGMTQTRKLAAILAADVVGYSRLAGADEDRTLTRLRALRGDLIDPAIEANHGRVVKQTGDGILVEFRSVVDAVRCATEVQNGMIERNSGLPPERRIEFRVGIHLGDVVEESDGDLMGDGVNIAARLEGITKPGTIYLSEDAYRQVKARLDLAVNDLGEHNLKNIAEPVRVYSLEVSKPAQAKPTKPAARKQRSTFVALAAAIVALVVITAGIWLTVRPARGPEMSARMPRLSIVVLPFANLSGDPAQDYLADVITEGLTAGLSRINGTIVIARSTAFTYKGKPVDVKQIGRDLGVRYLLEGGEQRSGNQVRVNAQLIDAETGAHLWADQFDADRADLLQMQDEIVTRLARALKIKLTTVDAARVGHTRPGNLDAEDLAGRCKARAWNAAPGKEWEAALALCAQALQIDDSNVTALGRMASWYILPVLEAQSPDPQAAIRHADELASRHLPSTRLIIGLTSPRPVCSWPKIDTTRRSSRRNAAFL
jgi:adenylate cyclase